MSMLAEPRRKQKWSVDPRNSSWSKDESKFGQKMLERMGWSKGKGLGKSEQGSTDHIKVKVKNNNLGLGTTASYEDNWIAHQDDFNQLLTELNNCHGQNNDKESPSEEKPQQGFSLEEKSKTSKKRVHYMKFTKGKDLSSRSETDLNCIFGKRTKRAKDQEEENNSSDSQRAEEENVPSATSPPDVEAITKTVTSALSMQEYFAQRMAKLKKARGQAQAPASLPRNKTSGLEDPDAIRSANDAEEPTKKKKKKKKSREAAGDAEAMEQEGTVIEEKSEVQEPVHPEKKKRKRKADVEDIEGAIHDLSGLGENAEENGLKKKKKKKCSAETDLLNGHGSENQTIQSGTTHKKKKKSKTQVDSEMTEEVVVVPEKKSKKEKKRK